MNEKALPLRIACGFVLYRRRPDGRALEYLTLTSRAGEIGLAKGHMDAGESRKQTARRETAEETGLTDLDIRGDFRVKLKYHVTRRRREWRKHVYYYAARVCSGTVRLSDEHTAHAWLPLAALIDAMPHKNLQTAVRKAALFLKDPALFEMDDLCEADADRHLRALPEASEHLLGHLRGGARLARRFAEGLAAAGVAVNVEATAMGTLLHDVGRALGEHTDHQRAGLRHLRKTELAPYGFACISHFTKGAKGRALRAAGLPDDLVADFKKLIDLTPLTWEERCAALADACMRGDTPVRPKERFADLRTRYDAPALIDLQEERTERVRAKLEKALGRDPLELVGLA